MKNIVLLLLLCFATQLRSQIIFQELEYDNGEQEIIFTRTSDEKIVSTKTLGTLDYSIFKKWGKTICVQVLKEGSYQDTISSWSYNSFLLTRNEYSEARRILKTGNTLVQQDSIFFYGENKIAWENLLLYVLAFGLFIYGFYQKDTNNNKIVRNNFELIFIFGICIAFGAATTSSALSPIYYVIAAFICVFAGVISHIVDTSLFYLGFSIGIGWAIGIGINTTWPAVVAILLIYGIIYVSLRYDEKRKLERNGSLKGC